MADKPVSLQLAEVILDLFRNSGATQVEQFAALDVARALVPVGGAPLVTTPDSQSRLTPE